MPAAAEIGYRPRQSEAIQEKKFVTYELDHDTRKYGELRSLRFSNPELYSQKKQGLDGETIFNLETAVGERLNAALSRRIDSVENGLICNKHTGEPLQVIYERGRDYRRELGSSPHDQMRESAEVEGFKKIQQTLLDERTSDGTMMLSISPPGGENSIYTHNFYDVFTKKRNVKGEVEIEARRYSSGLDEEAYIKKAEEIHPDYFMEPEAFQNASQDVYFLSRPIKIEPAKSKFKSPDDIHRDFHKTHEALSEKEFTEVLRVIKPFIHAYIEVLATDPYATEERNLTYNAILNKADEVVEALKNTDQQEYDIMYSDDKVDGIQREDIIFMGRKRVRETKTGCGLSGGASGGIAIGANGGAFSVSSFGGTENSSMGLNFWGYDSKGSLMFKCKRGHINIRVKEEFKENCGSCGMSVRC